VLWNKYAPDNTYQRSGGRIHQNLSNTPVVLEKRDYHINSLLPKVFTTFVAPLNRNQIETMVTFIAPAFNERFETYTFIGSMLCQKDPNWKAIIYHNGPNKWLKYFVESFADSRLTYKESATNTGAWGCYNREDCIQNLVDTEYIVQTSIQDFWIPNAVSAIIEQKGSDFIYWNSINHLAGYHNILESRPEIDHIDWGNFAIKTSIARQIGIRHPEEFTADGLFVTDCMNSGLVNSQVKIPLILTIHN
jgi:hypothetical protein